MDLETSSQSNEELTTDVNDFIAKLVELDDNDSLWDYISELPAISIFCTLNGPSALSDRDRITSLHSVFLCNPM